MGGTEAVRLEALEIPGYQIEDELGRGARGVVYRARRGDVTYAVKMQADHEDRSLLTFGAILACIRHPGLPEVVEVGQAGGRPYLVREYIAGYTLAAELEAGPLQESELVEIAKTLAGALDAVHRHGLIHRDVKPANILLARTGGARLIDFGFATHMNASRDSTAGTYLYSAPEQTGVLEAPLDQRTDLYALGATMFCCATGRPPYQGENSAEVLRAHGCAPVPRVADFNPRISPALALVIEKLLAKDPRDRYQTGQSLLADLRALAKLNSRLAAGEPVALGESGRELRTGSPTLVGRDAELEELLTTIADVAQGGGQSVLIEGEGGSGKSLLAQEFLRRAPHFRPLVLQARCERGQAPFASIRSWVESYFASLAEMPAGPRRQVEEHLHRFAAGLGGFLGRLGPAAAAFFGLEPAESVLENSDQFQQTTAEFLLELARIHGCLVLLLDDAHELDEAGHKVLRRLRLDLPQAPLMLLATSRSSQEAESGWSAYLESATPDRRLALEPLGQVETELLVYSLLGSRPVNPELVHQVAFRSHGNPFATTEYVRAMLRSGVVLPSLEGWRLDYQALQSLALPEDILKLVLQRIGQLDPAVSRLLTTAAVFGSRFGLDVLEAVEGQGTVDLLEAAVRANLVEPCGTRAYLFVHDRIREAFLSDLDAERERTLHRRLAAGLDVLVAARPELVYAAARHHALGGSEASQVYESNLSAGLMALEDYAFEEAYGFLAEAARYGAGRTRWLEPLSQACERTGRVEEAVSLLERLLEGKPDPLRRARFLGRLSKLRQSKLDRAQARDGCRQALAAMGQTVLDHPVWNGLAAVVCFGRWMTAAQAGLGQGTARGEDAERQRTLAELYQSYSEGEYFDMHYPKMLEMGSRACLAAHRLGPSSQMITSYSNMMIVFGMLRKQELVERWAARVEKVALELGDPVSLCHFQVMRHVALHMAGLTREVDEGLEQCLSQKGHLMESWVYLIGVADLAWSLFMRGYVNEAWAWVERGMERCQLTSVPSGVNRDLDILACYAISCLAVLGRPGEAARYAERLEAHAVSGQSDRSMRANQLAHLLTLHLESRDLGPSMEQVGATFQALGLHPALTPLHRRHFYVQWAYCWLERCQGPKGDLKQLDAALKLLAKAANRPVLRCHYLAVLGGRQFLAGRHEQALATLSQAQDLADVNDVPWVSYEVARQRARILARMGNHQSAAREAARAHQLAVEFGWPRRARAVAREFSLSRTSGGSSSRGSSGSSDQAGRGRLEDQLGALVNLSLASVQVTSPAEQARVVLDELIRLLNAERAYLFAVDDEKLGFLTGRDREGASLSAPRGYSRTVVETVHLNREPMVVAGTEQGEALGAASVVAYDLRSIICTPLMIRNRVVGVVYLDNRLARGVFTERDVDLLKALSSHIAIAMETSRAAQLELEIEQRDQTLASVSKEHALLQRSVQRLNRLLEGARAIAGRREAGQVVETLRRTAGELIPHQAFVWVPVDGHGQAAVPAEWAALESFCRNVARSGEPLRLSCLEAPLGPLHSLLAVPVRQEAKVHGVVVLLGLRTAQFNQEHQDLLTILAYQAGTSLANLSLQREVMQASKLAAVGQLAAGMAHELNNPLGAAQLALESASGIPGVPESALGRLATAAAGVGRASEIVSSLFYYATQDPDSRVREVDLNELVRSTLARLDYAFQAVEVSVALDPGLPRLQGNPDELAQLLANLLLNARDAVATSEGHVRVATRRQAQGVVLEVADNGPGFSEEVAARAFEPFFTTKPVGKGTGLGLALCDRIAARHNGSIAIGTSDLGGARLTVTL